MPYCADDIVIATVPGAGIRRVWLWKPARGGWLVKDVNGTPYWVDTGGIESVAAYRLRTGSGLLPGERSTHADDH
jgi:hypothetical protein